MKKRDLKEVQNHFQFGKNWHDFTNTISEESISNARSDLEKLVTKEEIEGKTFLDIGSGSGIHSLAALQNGASFVYSMDIDEDSVLSTTETINRFYKGNNFKVQKLSIFEADTGKLPEFDIVYSWGVLHHTGAMASAIEKAGNLVSDGGLLVLALYSKTLFCNVWKAEKKFYTKAPEWVRKILRGGFISLIRAKYLIIGKRFETLLSDYKSKRGMSFSHDVHDWMGGYPYESISEKQLTAILEKKGFNLVRKIPYNGRIGFLGTGCFEVTYKLKEKNED